MKLGYNKEDHADKMDYFKHLHQLTAGEKEFSDFLKTADDLPKPTGLEYDRMQMRRLLTKDT